MATTGRYSRSNHKLISLNDSTAKDKGKGKAVDNFMEQYDVSFHNTTLSALELIYVQHRMVMMTHSGI